MEIMHTLYKYMVLLFVFFCSATCEKRNISCKEYGGNIEGIANSKLIHVIAAGNNDNVHYLWSTYKLPSVIVARTNINSSVTIDQYKLENLQSGAINFSDEPLAVTGITVSQFWEKLYASNTDEINQVASQRNLNLESFGWKIPSNISFSCLEDSASSSWASFKEGEELFSQNGTFNVQFSASGSDGPASDFPHLIYTGNSTQVKFVFDNLFSNYSRVRYALEVMNFHSHPQSCQENTCKAVYSDSISDEFSPGVFSDVDLIQSCPHEENEGPSFMRWRPVAYISPIASVANTSDAQLVEACQEMPVGVVRSIAELYFRGVANSSTSAFNITFGTEGDGFYPKTKYTDWSLMLGTGNPATNKLSVTAIVFVSIGLGALALFFVSGVIFLSVQHCRRKDDDLLLSTTN